MSAKPDAVIEPEAFAQMLDQAELPAVVLPLVGACATPDGQRIWKGAPLLPREADVTASLLERKAHPRWRDAVRDSLGLDAISDALGRYLAKPTLAQPPLARAPADFIVAGAAETRWAASLPSPPSRNPRLPATRPISSTPARPSPWAPSAWPAPGCAASRMPSRICCAS